jgi:hypothetical protein
MFAYSDIAYARTLDHIGDPLPLVHSGGWALKRNIAGTNLFDAVGSYPLLCCQQWSGLLDDIRELKASGFVSFTAVIDPFCPTGEEFLRACFPDKLVRFKKHYIADLRNNIDQNLSPHHKRSIKASLEITQVEEVTAAGNYANEWITLYEELCDYRGITGGFALFSRPALAAQLALPGALVLRGFNENGVTAMQIWLHNGDHAYFHLGASNRSGYRDKASFALTWHALHRLKKKGVYLADLGGTSGEEDSDASGLAQFKAGWSTHALPAWLAGAVLAPERYSTLSSGIEGDYFPLYRKTPGTPPS